LPRASTLIPDNSGWRLNSARLTRRVFFTIVTSTLYQRAFPFSGRIEGAQRSN
jgi:hypothetical protein